MGQHWRRGFVRGPQARSGAVAFQYWRVVDFVVRDLACSAKGFRQFGKRRAVIITLRAGAQHPKHRQADFAPRVESQETIHRFVRIVVFHGAR